MQIEYKYSHDNINWQELADMYKLVPMVDMPPSELETVFSNSMFKCFAFDSGKLIGAGRALADGIDCSYICHIAVNPNYQGLGIGKTIVGKLVELSKDHKKIILYANPGKENFYKKFGFKPMATAMAIFKAQDLAIEKGYILEQ